MWEVNYVIVSLLIVFGISTWWLRFYARPGCSRLVLITAFYSWFCTLTMMVILPLDIASSSSTSSTRNRELLEPFWKWLYWTAQVMCWIVLPFQQSYYESGEFTVWGKLKHSLVMNGALYGVMLALTIAFSVYLIAVDRMGRDELVGFFLVMANTWGLVAAVLLLGYGLVEVPRYCWQRVHPEIRLKYKQYQIAQLNGEREDNKQELLQLSRLVDLFTAELDGETPLQQDLRKYIETIKLHCPDRESPIFIGVHDHGGEPHSLATKYTAKGISRKLLVQVHGAVIEQVREHARLDLHWNHLINQAFHLESIISHRKGMSSGASGSGGCCKRMLWRFNVYMHDGMWRVLTLVAVTATSLIVWSEVTLMSGVDLSPIGIVLRHTRGGGMLVLSLLPLFYIALCTLFSLFRIRLSKLYHMNARRRTDENSLILNGSYQLRLLAPLAYNFLAIIRTQETGFHSIMGRMSLIPFLGSSFNIYFPIIIILVCLFTLCNVYGRVLKCLGIARFEHKHTFDDEVLEEGRILLRGERAKRGLHDPSLPHSVVPSLAENPVYKPVSPASVSSPPSISSGARITTSSLNGELSGSVGRERKNKTKTESEGGVWSKFSLTKYLKRSNGGNGDNNNRGDDNVELITHDENMNENSSHGGSKTKTKEEETQQRRQARLAKALKDHSRAVPPSRFSSAGIR